MDWSLEQVFNICERKPQKQLPTHPAFSDASSSQGSCKRFSPNNFGVGPKKIKFICNFGGAFLPRPSDGELRYVGGERHLVQINRDTSWHELTCKTAKLIRRDHTIRYHLPGEQLSMLISITSDDDLRNMIDECIVLEANREGLITMYLFSADDDEHSVHFVVARSSHAEKEAQFIALINGLARPSETNIRMQSITAELPKASSGPLERTLPTPSFLTRMATRKHTEGNLIASGRKTTGVHFGSSVPSESMYAGAGAAKRGPAGVDQAVSRHQPELQPPATIMIEKAHQATGAQEKGSPRKELLIPLDNSNLNTSSSSNPNNNSPAPRTSRAVYETPVYSSRGSQKTVNQQTSSDMMMEMPEHSHEPATPTQCQDDMHNSSDLHTLEKPVATNIRKKQQPKVPVTSNSDETVLPSSFTSSDKTTEMKPNTLVRASSERQQERRSITSRPDEQLSKTIKSRSVGADSNSLQIRVPSQEAKDNTASFISELEEHEAKNNEQGLPKTVALGRSLTSNVQIISNEDLEDLREMGSGAFGTVFHGKWKGTDVAIKRIKNSCFMLPSPQADKLIAEFWREAAIISNLHHPNILALYGVVNNGPGATLATVTEFMVNGSLKKVLLRKDKYLDWRKRIMLAMDAAIGMEYLHSKDIVHFDLKCDNLLVNVKDPSRPICKVADFGLSKMKQATLVSGGMRGTLPWMAPELLTMSGTKVSEKIDVYSFGIVMWEILTGEDPYDGMHYGGVIGGILSNTLRPPVPTSCIAEWRQLMEQCWSTEPERRPSFTEVASRLRAILEASQIKTLN